MRVEMQFAPSLMCMDFLNIDKQIQALNKRADLLHADIMDGHFCQNLALSPEIIKAVRKVSSLEMDVHLMTTYPMDWIDMVAEAGATYISPHAETINSNAFRILDKIVSSGCKTGVVLNPATPLSYIKTYINRIQILTIMTIDTGFVGQPFIEEMLDKIREASKLKAKNGYMYKIQVDGSCNKKNYKILKEAGAEILIVGKSGLFGLDTDVDIAYDKMLRNFAEVNNGA